MPRTSRNGKVLGRGYETDPIREYAESFASTVNNIVKEANVDYYRETGVALRDPQVKNDLKKFFVENSFDKTGLRPSEIELMQEETEALFENDIEAMNEATATNTFNALVGMALPMHKNIMMNMVWDKGGIPKKTAPSEKFTRTMETRLLITPDGEEIDMWLEQNKMTKAMTDVNPWKTHRFVKDNAEAGQTTFAESATFDPVKDLLGKESKVDHIDIESYVSAVRIPDVQFHTGDILPDENGFIPEEGGKAAEADEKHDVWIKVRKKFTPGYGDIKRQLMAGVSGTFTFADGEKLVQDVIVGNIEKDRFMVSTMNGVVTGIEVSYKLDASTRTIDVCTVGWKERTDIVEIGTDPGISTTISPEEIKDISVLYNVNQLTKVMSLMKTALANRKDDQIKEAMELSYYRLPQSQRFAGTFDYAAREGYLLDHIEWRQKTFWDYFDTQITQMFRVLNDPNMTVSVYGEPDIIRKLTPKTYTYQAPSNIGPVELDFSKTVCTSDKRVYSFVGSDKLRTNEEPELIITLNPRNTMRIVYVIYDYQFYISNEIRKNNNPALPNILAFERWLFDEYQPVQGRIKIANPSGLKPGTTETVPFQVFTGY